MCITVGAFRVNDFSSIFCDQPRVVVVAEIGNNHEGDLGMARELIATAAACGADAVKFQHFVPDRYVAVSETSRLSRLRQFALTNDELLSLFQYSRELEVEPFATAFDLETQKWLLDYQRVIKISSGDNNFYDLLRIAGDSGTPTIVSTGLLSMAGVIDLEKWWRLRFATPIALLHCVAAYPARSHDLNLRTIKVLSERMPNTPIGYSDHSMGTIGALAAVALGAFLIEKHFTLDHNYSDFRDHQLSANPQELAELTSAVRMLEQALGNGLKSVTADEILIEPSMRRSAAASCSLPAGRILEKADIVYLRPGHGYSPDRERELLGRRLSQDVEKGQTILDRNLSPQ